MLAAAALVNLSELTDVELDAPVARTSDSADPAQPTLMFVVRESLSHCNGTTRATSRSGNKYTRCPQATIICGADIA